MYLICWSPTPNAIPPGPVRPSPDGTVEGLLFYRMPSRRWVGGWGVTRVDKDEWQPSAWEATTYPTPALAGAACPRSRHCGVRQLLPHPSAIEVFGPAATPEGAVA